MSLRLSTQLGSLEQKTRGRRCGLGRVRLQGYKGEGVGDLGLRLGLRLRIGLGLGFELALGLWG
jgi:hypothetical protein